MSHVLEPGLSCDRDFSFISYHISAANAFRNWGVPTVEERIALISQRSQNALTVPRIINPITQPAAYRSEPSRSPRSGSASPPAVVPTVRGAIGGRLSEGVVVTTVPIRKEIPMTRAPYVLRNLDAAQRGGALQPGTYMQSETAAPLSRVSSVGADAAASAAKPRGGGVRSVPSSARTLQSHADAMNGDTQRATKALNTRRTPGTVPGRRPFR